jgi:isopentenyldiphosphate isomerase
MEFLDVVNERDEIVGKASKTEVYEKRLPHRIVHVLISNDRGEMALQLRGNVSFCPHHWCTAVGGHVQSGESCEKAALREFAEELGTKAKIELAYKDFYNDDRDLKKFLYTFTCTFNGPFTPDPKDVDRVEFFSLNKIRAMIDAGEKFHPELLFLLKKHFGF